MMFRKLLLAAALLVVPLIPADAAQVGHSVPCCTSTGYYMYLADSEYMYPGDYMIAEHSVSFVEPMEVVFASDGDLQVWFDCEDLSCNGDPTGPGGYGWHMLWHSDTHQGGYVRNYGGNLQIVNSGGTTIWSVGDSSTGTHWFYAYQLGTPPGSPGCASYVGFVAPSSGSC